MDVQKPSFFDRLFGADTATYSNNSSPKRQQNRLLHMVWGRKHRRGRVIVNPDLFWDSSEDSDEEEEDEEEDEEDDDEEVLHHSSRKSIASCSGRDIKKSLRRRSIKTQHQNLKRSIILLPTKRKSSKSATSTAAARTGVGAELHHHDHEYANRVYAATLNKLQSPPYDLRVNVALWCILSKSTNTATTNTMAKTKQQQLHEKLLPPLLYENPTGKRKVSCRYFLMLLETPVNQVRQNRHPIHEAVDRHRRRFQDVTIVTTAQHDPPSSKPFVNNKKHHASSESSPTTVVKKAKSFPTYWKRQREQQKQQQIRCATATIAEELKERRKKEILHNNKGVHSSNNSYSNKKLVGNVNTNKNNNIASLTLPSTLSLSSASTISSSSASSSASSFTSSFSQTTNTSFSSVRRRSDGVSTTEDDDQDDIPLGLLKKTSVENI